MNTFYTNHEFLQTIIPKLNRNLQVTKLVWPYITTHHTRIAVAAQRNCGLHSETRRELPCAAELRSVAPPRPRPWGRGEVVPRVAARGIRGHYPTTSARPAGQALNYIGTGAFIIRALGMYLPLPPKFSLIISLIIIGPPWITFLIRFENLNAD